MQLEFTIENQRLSRTDKNFVVEKSQNYLYSHFDFTTNDWEVATRYAIFTNEKYNQENALMVEIDLETNTCLVPYQILLDTCSFHVNVVGVNSDGEYIITTNESNVIVAKINTTNGIHPDEPQPSFLQQLFEKVSNSYNNFKFVYNETDGTLKLTMIDNDGKEHSKVVDLPMEQVVKNVSYNENTSTLTIEWINGQKTEINFEQFIKSYSADEITLTLSENNTFSIKQEWINEINQKIGKLEEHSISDLFYERITASDSTSSKYEIENGSIARPIKIGGMTYKSDNLQPREWSGLNDRIELNTTLKEGQSYTLCVNLPPTTGSRGLNLYDDKNNVLFSNEMTGWTDPKSGWNSFVITAVTDTTSLRINAYGFKETSMQGAIYSGELVDKNKYNAINLYTPYFEGLRDTAVTEVKSVSANLFNPNKEVSQLSYTEVTQLSTGIRATTTANKINDSTDIYSFVAYNFELSKLKSISNTFRLIAKITPSSTNIGRILIVYKDINNNTLSNKDVYGTDVNTTINLTTLPIGTEYVRLTIYSNNNGIAKAGDYVDYTNLYFGSSDVETYTPYWEERFEISPTIQNLEGYGKGINETYNNYVDFERKVFVQNVMEVDLGELRWEMGTSNTADIKRPYGKGLENVILKVSDNALICPTVCEKYNANSANDNYKKNKGIAVTSGGVITIYDENYNTADSLEAFKEYIKGVKAIIPLAEPIETDISDLITENQYKADNIGTETLLNEYEQKAYAEIGYSVSLGKQIIENSNNIANKLDKVTSTGSNRVYVITSNGVQTTYRFSNKKGAYELIMRDANGEAEVNDISDNSSGYTIANKNYVDNTAVAKVNKNSRVYVTASNGTQSDVGYTEYANRYTIPTRDANGNFHVLDLKSNSSGTYVANKNYVDSLKKRITQLEKASEGTILETLENDTQVSYVRQIEEDTLPYALLEKVGGMTYKSDNLIVIEDKEATTVNGVTYSIKNGVITLNGTATATTYITLIANCNLPLGTYSYNPKITTFPDGTYLNLANANGAYISNYAMTFENSVGRLQLQYNEGTTFSNTVIKPMLVSGSSIPSTFSTGFVGLRNSVVSKIVSQGANLLGFEDKEATTSNGITYTIKNGVITLNGTASAYMSFKFTLKAAITFTAEETSRLTSFANDAALVGWGFRLFTADNTQVSLTSQANPSNLISTTATVTTAQFYVNAGTVLTNLVLKPMVTRGSTIPTEYKPYKAPTIKEIPSAIQNLDGYDLGLPKVENCYNYVDFENKKFVKKLQKVVLDGSSDENIGLAMASNDNGIANFGFTFTNNGLSKHSKDGITDYFISNAPISHGLQTATTEEGVYINFTSLYIRVKSTTASTVEQLRTYLAQNPIIVVYEMATPIETDISDLLAGFDNVEKLEPLGSLTFENEYGQAVPNSLTYQRRL